MIENAINSLLLGDKTVAAATPRLVAQAATYAAAVAAICGVRIYRSQLPRSAAQLMQTGQNLPAIWFSRLKTLRQKTHDGPLNLVNAQVALHAVGTDTYVVAKLLEAARKLLDGWRGTAGPTPAIPVSMIWVEDGHDYFEDPIAAAELGIAESNIELDCWFKETLA